MEKYLLQLLGAFGSFVNLIYWIVRFVVLLTPENRKNIRSNVRDIKSVATSNKMHLIIAIAIFLVAVAFLVLSLFAGGAFWTVPGGDVNQEEENATIEFGGGKNKIEWIVIDKNRKYWTLMSKNCFEARPWQETLKDGKKLKWEKSSLKDWLNSEFVKNFSESEKSTMVEFRKGEFVTLLDEKQANKLKKEDKDLLICIPVSEEKADEKAKGWWLQTPGTEKHCVTFVDSFGDIWSTCSGYSNKADRSLYVRPVIRKNVRLENNK